MHGGKRVGRQREGDESSAVAGHAKGLPKQRLRGGRPERDNNPRLDDRNFGLEPWKACFDLDRARLAVNTARPTRHPFEVLDDVGYVGPSPFDSSLDQTAIQQLA